MSQVYIGRTEGQGLCTEKVLQAFEWLGWQDLVPAGARVFVKPNLTWPEHIPGVTTSPRAIEAVVAALSQRTHHITVGESDGGYHSFRAEEAFLGHNLHELERRYGTRVVNLSTMPAESVTARVAGRQVAVTLPRLLLYETDVFVALPVPKVHVMTGVSLAFKNQWGCLPSTMRLREHPEFDRKILALNRLLRPKLVIFDGTYFLDQAGPMTGDAIKMDLLVAGDDVGAASAVCCALMGIDPRRIRHLRLARREGVFPASLDKVTLNSPLDPFVGRQFVMKRALLDWISLLGFRSSLFARLFWDSTTADPIHAVLSAMRRNSLLCRLLYGKAGSPPEWQSESGLKPGR